MKIDKEVLAILNESKKINEYLPSTVDPSIANAHIESIEDFETKFNDYLIARFGNFIQDKVEVTKETLAQYTNYPVTMFYWKTPQDPITFGIANVSDKYEIVMVSHDFDGNYIQLVHTFDMPVECEYFFEQVYGSISSELSEVQDLIDNHRNESKKTNESEDPNFLAFDSKLDWAYGRLRFLNDKYQHSKISKAEYIDYAIELANKILEYANAAKASLTESTSEAYKGPGGGLHFDKEYPEGYLFEDWNSGVISFQKVDDNENMIQVFAPENEYGNQWGLSITDGNGYSLIDEATVKDIGDYEIETISLKTDDWAVAKDKIEKIINANPKAKELFGDFKVPDEVVDLMVNWNKLKDADIRPYPALKALGFVD